MPKRAITVEIYDRLVDIYRKEPENHKRAARYAGVDTRTAKRAWEVGVGGFEPAKTAVLRDAVRAQLAKEEMLEVVREQLAKEEKAAVEPAEPTLDVTPRVRRKATTLLLKGARDKARAIMKEADVARLEAEARLSELASRADVDRINSKVERARIVRDARRGAASLLSLVANLYGDYELISAKLRDQLSKLDDADLPKFVAYLSRLTKDAVEVATIAMQLEDRELGRPDVVVGVQNMSLPEAMTEIDEAKKLADLVRSGDVIDAAELPPADDAKPAN